MEKKEIKEIINETTDKISDVVSVVGDKTKELTGKVSEETIKLVDENGNNKIDLEDFVIKAMRIPGVYVDRTSFLKDALKKYCSEETIEKAVQTNPAKAHISKEIVEKAANDSIALQKSIVTAASTGLGYTPGGIAVDIATTVADIGQYYANILIIVQKLLYLYGYPELDFKADGNGIDDGTMNMILICIGVMAGVDEANKFLIKVSDLLAKGVPTRLIKMSLTKTLPFKIAAKVTSLMGIKLTKDMFSKGVGNAIKFAGGLIVGGITFATFSKCCSNFKKCINNTILCDPNYVDQANVVEGQYTVEKIEQELEEEIGEVEDIKEEDN